MGETITARAKRVTTVVSVMKLEEPLLFPVTSIPPTTPITPTHSSITILCS